MSDAPTTIGPYSVVREVGRGGMGVVYLARDPNLQRDVAIKSVPADFAANPERMARFEREARLLASLTHGNIAAVHGLVDADDGRHLVMEFVPGETLSAALISGPLGVEASLRVCAQIAAALEAAHDAGVVHRDIKPGNVIVRPDGAVKVLDFGLAREHGGGNSSSNFNATAMPTRTMEALTGRHVVIGTPGYMSPEQARGKPLDKRTDVFSFGCVLYECLTGRNAFTGETTTDVVAAVLEAEPDWSALPARTPTRIRELLRHCLEKDPARRLRDMGDARLEIERAIAGSEWSSTSLTGAPAAPAVRWRRLAPWIIAAAAVALGAGAWAVRPHAVDHTPAPRIASTILAQDSHLVWSAELAPDGRTVAFWAYSDRAAPNADEANVRGWWLRSIDSYESRLIPGTQRATRGVFSPDGQWYLYGLTSSDGAPKLHLYKVPVSTNAPPSAIAEFESQWMHEVRPAWLDDGTIAVIVRMPEPNVRLMDHRGGSIRDIPIRIDGGSVDFGMIRAVPGDPSRLFLNLTRYDEGKYVLDACVLDLDTGDVKTLIQNAGLPALLRPNLLLASRADTLLAAEINPDTYDLVSQPVAAMKGLRTMEVWTHAPFSMSARGDLLYLPGGVVGASRLLAVVEPDGALRPLNETGRAFDGPIAVSPDGTRIAATIVQPNGLLDIWMMDVDRPILRRITASHNADFSIPAWGPDNRTVYVVRRGLDEHDGVYAVDVDANDPPRLIHRLDDPLSTIVFSMHVSPKGGRLLLSMITREQHFARLIDPNDGADGARREAQTLFQSSAWFDSAMYSPDASLVSYASTESGRSEVYVRPVRPDGALGVATVVSTGGGRAPFWSTDAPHEEPERGNTLYYVDRDDRLLSVQIRAAPRLTIGAPVVHTVDMRKLFTVMRSMPGGRVLALLRSDDEIPTREINIIFNTGDMLRSRAMKSSK